MIFLSALLDVCELNHAKDIEKQLNEQFLKDTDVEAHIKLITRKKYERFNGYKIFFSVYKT